MNTRGLLSYNKGKIRLKAAVIFPDRFSVGAANLGFHKLYHVLSEDKNIEVKRFYIDSSDIIKLQKYSLICFSVSYVNSFINIPILLRKADIPLFKENRKKNIIIGGGFAITENPLFFSSIFDLSYCGDIDTGFMKIFFDIRDDLLSNNLSKVRNKFSSFNSIFKTIEQTKNPAHSIFLSDSSEFSNTFLIEISRGCPHHCAFCSVPIVNRYNAIPMEKIKSVIKRFSKRITKTGLINAGYHDLYALKDLIIFIKGIGLETTLSSFRTDFIDRELINLLVSAGQKTFTLAPETGSEKLRFKLNKRIKNSLFIERSLDIYRAGGNVRFYFIYGLPFTESDIEETEIFLRNIRKLTYHISEAKIKEPLIIEASFSPFVSLRKTPLEGHTFFIRQMKNIEKELKRRIKSIGGIRAKFSSVRISFLEYIIANSDDKIGRIFAKNFYNNQSERDFIRIYEKLM